MARLARVVAIDIPHHITQRGNAHAFVLESEVDRLVYLELLAHYSKLHRLSLLGYCIMANHVHLVAIPRRPESMALALKYAHGRYAAYFNARHASSGHIWQGRYYSCPLDIPHLWVALRYVELNPVRAHMVTKAEEYPWSSAAVHAGSRYASGLLDLAVWQEAWTFVDWQRYLADAGEDLDEETESIRLCTHTGRPFGTPDFVSGLEKRLHRQLQPAKGGRPKRGNPDARQQAFGFAP